MRFAVLTALLVALLVPAPSVAQNVPKPKAIETTKGRTKPTFPDQITEEYRVKTKYGTMYGTVIRPDPSVEKNKTLYSKGQGNQGKGVPVVLTLSPYNSIYQPKAGGPFVLARGAQEFFPPRGYAYAQFDVVGTRESGGCYDYGGIRERKTAAAVVDFLGSRTWSNGNVGMIGGSYDGTTQFAAAIEQPKHLKAIIPQVAIDRWYDYAYGGGLRYFLNSERPSDEGFDTPLAFDFGFALIPPTTLEEQSIGTLADRINPCDRLTHTRRGYEPDPVYDAFWEKRDYRARADRIQVPTFIESGWLDHNVKHWDSTRMFMALPDDLPKKLAIGQWRHSDSQFDDADDSRHAWFDYWLLGLNTGVMEVPAVDTQTNSGTRYQHSSWPPAGTKNVELPLALKATQRDLGLLDGEEASFVGDQTMTEDMALDGQCGRRCLVFATEPLPKSIRISGGPLVHLEATSTKPSTHYTPVLFEQTPEGERKIITRGFLNAFNRNGLGTSKPLEPGKPYVAPVDVWDTDYEIAAGNRLGVAVLSSNTVWALPDDDTAGQGGPATNTLALDGASRLELPLSRGAELFPQARRGPTTPAPGGSGSPADPGDGNGSGGVGDAGGVGDTGGGGDIGDTGGVGDTGGATLPATGAGAVLPGLLVLGLAVRLFALRRRS